jgi:hypothetical protein
VSNKKVTAPVVELLNEMSLLTLPDIKINLVDGEKEGTKGV